MQKNVASQYVYAVMVKTDGSLNTASTPTCMVALGNSTAAASTNTATYKGAGTHPLWTLALSQAETNSNQLAVVWTATSCIPVVQTYDTIGFDPQSNLPAAVNTISAGAVDSILDEPITEPSGVFAWGSATLRNVVGWLGAVGSNKMTQTSTTQTVRNRADSTTIATATHSDSGGTYTRGSLT